MADTKISGLSAITAPVSTDEGVLASSSTTKKITLANLAKALPGYEFGYDEITSPVTVSSATESSGTTVISCAAHTFDGSPVEAIFFSPGVFVNTAASASVIEVCLFEGATEIGIMTYHGQTSASISVRIPVVARYRFTPSAGSHTYTVTAFKSGTTPLDGTIHAGAGGTGAYMPAHIRFIKV